MPIMLWFMTSHPIKAVVFFSKFNHFLSLIKLQRLWARLYQDAILPCYRMAGRLLWFQRNDSRRLNSWQIIKFSNKMNPKRQQIQPINFQHRWPLQLFDYLYLSTLFVRNAESMEFTTCPLIKIIICLFLLASP